MYIFILYLVIFFLNLYTEELLKALLQKHSIYWYNGKLIIFSNLEKLCTKLKIILQAYMPLRTIICWGMFIIENMFMPIMCIFLPEYLLAWSGRLAEYHMRIPCWILIIGWRIKKEERTRKIEKERRIVSACNVLFSRYLGSAASNLSTIMIG